MTRIFLIRHAEAEGNLYRRSHGHFDGLITATGYVQIEQLKERFLNEKISAVYTSDLSRARGTAVAISRSHGLELRTDARLREVEIGAWEDVAWGDIEYNEPEMFEYFNSDPEKWSTVGSEPYPSVKERLTGCIKEIAEKHDGDTIVVISHGFAIRTFLCGVLGVESSDTPQVPYCDNTAVALLLYENGRLSVEYHGDNSHLRVENSTFARQNWWRGESERRRENLRYMPFVGTRDRQILELCREEVSTEFSSDVVFTAFLGDEQAGFLGLNTERDEENAGWIYHIYIVPELRRKGFSLQLLGQAISIFRKLGRDKLRILAPMDNAMLETYQRYGFMRIGGESIMEKDISLGR